MDDWGLYEDNNKDGQKARGKVINAYKQLMLSTGEKTQSNIIDSYFESDYYQNMAKQMDYEYAAYGDYDAYNDITDIGPMYTRDDVKVGTYLKELYVDSALKKTEKMDAENSNKDDEKKEIIEISWSKYKRVRS